MSNFELATGTIPSIIRNDAGIYEGDLKHYMKVLFFKAQNLRSPYHNFRHMTHMVWLCYQACLFYNDTFTPREKRNLLIAPAFHDFNHSGMLGDDDLNIERAVRAFQNNVAPEDKQSEHSADIIELIRTTEYPHKGETSALPLSYQIMRDADLGQTFSVAWIQQVVFGLAAEWGKQPIEVLKMQGGFLKNLKFHTKWGQQMFPQRVIDAKVKEAEELLQILES